MAGLSRVTVSNGVAVAQAGARWDDLLAVALARGLTPAVLTDYLGISVGGTLSVGGVGGTSHRHGLQSDGVEELTVATGTGEVVVCSERHDKQLFDVCRAGLGQCAILLAASVRLVEAPLLVRVRRLVYRELRSLLSALRGAAASGRFDSLLGSIRPDGHGWAFSLEAARYLRGGEPERADELSVLPRPEGESADTVLPYVDYVHRHRGLESMTRDGALHPWMDLFLPGAAAEDVVRFALEVLDPDDLHDGHIMTYAVSRHTSRIPLLELPGDADGVRFDVLPTVPAGDAPRLAKIETALGRVFERARDAGARIYPIGFPVGTPWMTSGDWRRQFGRAWGELVRAKTRCDPRGLLCPAFGIFGES